MAFVKRLITRTSQPQGLVGIDWSNPRAKGLVFATVDALGARSASGHVQNVVGTTFNRGVTPAGIGVSAGDTQNTSNTVILPASVRAAIVGKPFTLACLVDQTASSANAQSIYSHRDASSQSFYIGLNYFQVQIAASGFADVFINVPPTAKSFVFVGDGATVAVYCDGSLAGSATSAILAPATSILPSILNRSAGGGRAVISKVLKVALYARAFSASEAADEWLNPWQIFEPETVRIWIDDATEAAPPGDPTGTLSATETGSDTAVLSGQIVVQGTLAASDTGQDTAAFSGKVIVTGTLAAQETGGDTAALNGSASVTLTGTIAATEVGSDTSTLTGKLLLQGALSAVEVGSDTALINGSSVTITSGTLNAQESGGDTASMTGKVLVQALIDAVEQGADTAQLTGQIVIKGALAASEAGSDTAAIYSTAPVIYTAGAQTRPSRLQSSSRPSRVQTGTRASR